MHVYVSAAAPLFQHQLGAAEPRTARNTVPSYGYVHCTAASFVVAPFSAAMVARIRLRGVLEHVGALTGERRRGLFWFWKVALIFTAPPMVPLVV